MNRTVMAIVHRSTVSALVLLVACLISACQTDTPAIGRPAWIDRPSIDWPEDRYFSAAAAGSSRQEAADAALARLSQRIAVQVQSREVMRSTAVADTRLGHHERTTLERTVELGSAVLLLGAEVLETWEEPHEETFAALAVLDRAASAKAYDREIERLASRAGTEESAAAEATSTWSQFVHLGAALRAVEVHDQFVQIRAVVAPESQSWDRPQTLLSPSLEAQHRSLQGQISCTIELMDQSPDELGRALHGALGDAGIPVARNAPATVRARLRYEAVPRPFFQRRDHVVEWRVLLELIDAQDSPTADSVTLEGSGWGLTIDDASRSALRAAERSVAVDLAPLLIQLLYPDARSSLDTAPRLPR